MAVKQINTQMEAVEDLAPLKLQYQKAQQAYIKTQGDSYRTIGLLHQYKGKVESVEKQVGAQDIIYK